MSSRAKLAGRRPLLRQDCIERRLGMGRKLDHDEHRCRKILWKFPREEAHCIDAAGRCPNRQDVSIGHRWISIAKPSTTIVVGARYLGFPTVSGANSLAAKQNSSFDEIFQKGLMRGR